MNATTTPRRPPLVSVLLLLAATAGLPGCASMVVGAAATTGIAIAQERSVGNAIDDTAIKVEINHYLFQAQVDELFRAVSVDVNEGRVLLTGNVKTQALRDRATELAYKAEGVQEVFNEIEVQDSGGILDYSNDAWISTQLRAKLLGDAQIYDINYSVTTSNGVIYLLGIAQNQEELDRAVAHARSIPRVRRVVSHVLMKDDPMREG
ncbi:MAG: phospholipid-binding domain-containing protein [Rhodospirillaceae bacterium]|nr:phospholipid-binding domain-containing protein [Rhodospirillaceae bacterium]